VGTTHRVQTTVSFPESFSSIEDAWGRGVVSTGYSAATTNFSIPYCRVVSHTSTSVTLETFVHDVSRTNGSYAGWYPVKPSNIKCAYTVLGEPGTPDLPPAAPSNLVMTNAGQVNQNPQLDWDDNTEPDLDHYTVYRCASHFQTCTWTAIGTPTSSSFTDFGVTIAQPGNGDDEYRYYVSATDTGGQESASSNTVSTWGTTPLLRGPTADDGPGVPETYALGTSYPNPVRAQTTIRSLRPAGSIGRDAHRL
jgi:hypothetical protein